MALTDVVAKNAKSIGKTFKLSDERGLYLEVSPNGGKWWRLKYRFGGKEKRLALGVYPDVKLKDARERRDAARNLLAKGTDPSENRKAQKAARIDSTANSFKVVTREWLAKYSALWAENHGDRIVRRFERDIFVDWRPANCRDDCTRDTDRGAANRKPRSTRNSASSLEQLWTGVTLRHRDRTSRK